MSQKWSGSKSYEWSEYCANPKLKTNRQNAVKKPYRIEKKAFDLYYSASLHETEAGAIPKMVYAALFLLFAVPAMVMFTYGRITESLADPTNLIAQEKAQEEKQEAKQPDSQPIQAVQHVVTPQTKTNLSMVSDLVDWSQVGACLEKKDNCICYGHKAQRLNIAPETYQAAAKFGWLVTKQF